MSITERISQLQGPKPLPARIKTVSELEEESRKREEFEREILRKELLREEGIKTLLAPFIPLLEEINKELLGEKGLIIQDKLKGILELVWGDIEEFQYFDSFSNKWIEEYRSNNGKLVRIKAYLGGKGECTVRGWTERVREKFPGGYREHAKYEERTVGAIYRLQYSDGFEREELIDAVARAFLNPIRTFIWTIPQEELESQYSRKELRRRGVLLLSHTEKLFGQVQKALKG